MVKKAKTKDVAKKTIEQTLWDSANELRGNLDAAEYKSVVLGLVFLKYINDCFKVKHDELIAEGAGFEEDPDEYIGDNIFFVPIDARWDKIVKASLTAEIGVVVDAAMEALEKEVADLEAEKKRLEEALCSGTLSVEELTEYSKRLPVLNDELDEKSMRWLELSEVEG